MDKPLDMSKEDYPYSTFRRFFIILTIYSFIVSLLLRISGSYMFSRMIVNATGFRYVFNGKLLIGAMKMTALIPIVILIFHYRKKAKLSNQLTSLKLYDAIAFVVLICGIALPLVTIAVDASNEIGDIFSILAVALCMLLCGIFADIHKLKLLSYIYFMIPTVILTILGMIITYSQITDFIKITARFFTIYGYIGALFYIIYPSIGYLTIAVCMSKRLHIEQETGHI